MTAPLAIQAAARCLLVMLFLPFSALDKILDFDGAVAQAQELTRQRSPAVALIAAGLSVEVVMSLAVVAGFLDRIAALVLAGYCVVTALLWKQFWRHGDFWSKGPSTARDLFWDFLKNFSLAGGFLILTFGTTANSTAQFIRHPLRSSNPYGAFQDATR